MKTNLNENIMMQMRLKHKSFGSLSTQEKYSILLTYNLFPIPSLYYCVLNVESFQRIKICDQSYLDHFNLSSLIRT